MAWKGGGLKKRLTRRQLQRLHDLLERYIEELHSRGFHEQADNLDRQRLLTVKEDRKIDPEDRGLHGL